jgi:hypothetical protein
MTYPCTDCILDHMAASGPQTRQDLRRECRTQAVPYDNLIFAAAIDQLLAEGKIVFDSPDDGDPYFDFPESYYNARIGITQ